MWQSTLRFFAALFDAAKSFFQFKNQKSVEKAARDAVEIEARKEARDKNNELQRALDEPIDISMFDKPKSGSSNSSE